MLPVRIVVPVPAIVREPTPVIANESVIVRPLCLKSNRPLSVIAPVIEVTGLVISAVVPELIVPPLVTVFVFVCAEALAAPSRVKRQ